MEGVYYRKQPKKFDPARLLKNKRLLLGSGAGLLLFGYVFFGSHGILQRIRLEREKAKMEEKIRLAEDETLRLQQESKALESDLKMIEKVAREKYGMAREGETVYRVRKAE
jgi:cell division protein FtsB